MDRTSTWAINDNTIAQLRTMSRPALDFVTQVYIPDLLAIASFYKDWAVYGRRTRQLSVLRRLASKSSPYAWGNQWLPRGMVLIKTWRHRLKSWTTT